MGPRSQTRAPHQKKMHKNKDKARGNSPDSKDKRGSRAKHRMVRPPKRRARARGRAGKGKRVRRPELARVPR